MVPGKEGAAGAPWIYPGAAPPQAELALEDEEQDNDQDNSAEADIHKNSDGIGRK